MENLDIPESKDPIVEKSASIARLRFKERHYEYLTHEEFDDLLDFDFKDLLRYNPSIEGGFSSEEELMRIKKLPKDQKKAALTKFKENWVVQKNALASCRIFIERYINIDNDVPKEKLMDIVEKFGSYYSFTNEQKNIAEKIIDEYYVNRQRVLEIRKRFPDDVALVSELTGIKFDKTAQFLVSIGPMSIDITTDGFNAGRIYENSSDAVPKLPYGGFATKSNHEHPIPYIVINHSVTGISEYDDMVAHEHEHLKNSLFRKIFDNNRDVVDQEIFLYQYEAEKDDLQFKKDLLDKYFILYKEKALNDAKDEILAMRRYGIHALYTIFFEQNGSPYDYLAYLRENELKKDDILWQDASKKILVEEYRKIIEDANNAFDKLEQGGYYSKDEAIAIFSDKPLSDWPKTAIRLSENKPKFNEDVEKL